MFNTTPLRTRQTITPLPGTSPTPSTPTNYNRTLDSRRKALGAGGNRDRGTPVGRLLADEGMMMGIRSPRKIQTRSLSEKVKDWPSNFLLSLETSISLIEYDPLGYPLAILFNGIHLLTRFSVFTAKIPNWRDITRIGDRMGDADARLEYLRKKSLGDNSSWKAATILSIILVLISITNTVYLYTRKRRYHLMLRQDPLSSPNASSSTLDFSPPRSIFQSIKRKALNLIWSNQESNGTTLEIQQLDVWTPDYVKWSLRLFSLYPPPISIMYHFLTPSNFFPFIICGTLLVFQNFLLITSYTQLLADRQTLQAEVMHEYNSKFVHPRIFVQKRDMGTSTNEAEFVGFRNSDGYAWFENGAREELQGRELIRRSSVGVGIGTSGSSRKISQVQVGSPRKSIGGTPRRAQQPVESEEEDDEEEQQEEQEEEEDEDEAEEEDEEEIERQRQLEKEKDKMKIKARRQRGSIAASTSTASPGITASGRKKK